MSEQGELLSLQYLQYVQKPNLKTTRSRPRLQQSRTLNLGPQFILESI